MCMYVCVDAVRPKCNDFMAPAFAVRMVLAYRKASLVMLRAVGLCFRTHPVTSAPGASEHMFTRTVELAHMRRVAKLRAYIRAAQQSARRAETREAS